MLRAVTLDAPLQTARYTLPGWWTLRRSDTPPVRGPHTRNFT